MTATPQHCQCNGGKMLTLTAHLATCLQPCVRVPPHAPFLVVGECGLGSAHSPTTLSPPLFFQLLVYCYYATLTTNERDRRTPTTTTRRRDEAPKCRKRNTRFQEAKLTTPGGKGRHPIWLWRTRPPPPPRNPYIRGGNPKTRGRSPNFQNTEKLHAFWYSWDLSFFLSFFDIFQPRAPLERPLTTHERGRRTPTATTRIAFRLAWCPSWCIFRRCERLWVGLFPLSHPLATSFKLPGEK